MRLLGALLLSLALAASATGAAEPGIQEISVQGLASIKQAELLYLLGIELGRPLDKEELRRGIRRAFKKGVFEQIEVRMPSPGRLLVKVRERDFIERIRFKGQKLLSKKFLRRHLPLKEGEALRPDLLGQAEEALREALRLKGFPRARVSIKVKASRRPYRVRLLVSVKEGPPLYVRTIRVYGRPLQEVLTYLGLTVGDIYDQFRLKEGLDRLKRYYKRLGHYGPQVGPYTFAQGTLFLNVIAGERLVVRFEGNDSIGDRRLRRLLPFFEAEALRDDLVQEALKRMEALYHQRGYPMVQIAPVLSRKEGLAELSFYFYEGPRTEVAQVEFEGATLSERALKALIRLRPGRPYNPQLLEADRHQLEEFYASLGYLDVQVQGPEVEFRQGLAYLKYRIREGSRYSIGEVRIEGAKAFPEKELLEVLALSPGSPYNELDVSNARYRLIEHYNRHGYDQCEVELKRRFRKDKVALTFRLKEGSAWVFGSSVVAGNRRTATVVITRELLHRRGEPFSHKLLLRERQELYELGLFEEVHTQELQRYQGKVDVLYRVREAPAGAVEFGLGYGEYEGLRGFASLSYRNLWGMAREGSLRAELSTLQKRLILSYREPWFMGHRVPLRAFLLAERREEKNIDTGEVLYRVRRYLGTVGLEKRLSSTLKGELYYEFSLVKTTDVKPGVVLSKEDTGTLAISALKPALLYDTRDDPFEPTRGVFAGASLKVASALLLSETGFAKLRMHASTYRALGRRLVLAASVRLGLAQGFEGTEELPLVERFFLGGRNTVRGYHQDTLGPRTPDGNPTGGNAFLMGNLELRLRVRKGWGLVAFLDWGNVWQRTEDMDIQNLRGTVGVGLRYSTPVGPLRVDYGYKLQDEPPLSRAVLHFSIGHAF
jgi:outer membrane protein insertion porin family